MVAGRIVQLLSIFCIISFCGHLVFVNKGRFWPPLPPPWRICLDMVLCVKFIVVSPTFLCTLPLVQSYMKLSPNQSEKNIQTGCPSIVVSNALFSSPLLHQATPVGVGLNKPPTNNWSAVLLSYISSAAAANTHFHCNGKILHKLIAMLCHQIAVFEFLWWIKKIDLIIVQYMVKVKQKMCKFDFNIVRPQGTLSLKQPFLPWTRKIRDWKYIFFPCYSIRVLHLLHTQGVLTGQLV